MPFTVAPAPWRSNSFEQLFRKRTMYSGRHLGVRINPLRSRLIAILVLQWYLMRCRGIMVPRETMAGGIMMLMHEAIPGLVDQDVSAVQGGGASVSEIERRLAPYVARAEPRQRAMASRQGLLSPAERTNSGPVAEVSGDATPDACQHRRRRARWDPEAGRDELRREVVQPLRAPEAVLVLDDTGLLNTGRHAAGVARPYRGTAGTVDHGHMGVLLGAASALGHALVDRERDLPEAWTDTRERCQHAGIPADRPLAAGVPARWVTGDRVSGHDGFAKKVGFAAHLL